MFASYRPILSLLRGTAFLLAASGLHGLLLPLRGQAEGFTTATLGLLGTAWAAGFVAGCFFAPRLVRRVGHVRAFGAFAASGAIIALLTGLLISGPIWIALRMGTGFTMAGAFMVIESWLNEYRAPLLPERHDSLSRKRRRGRDTHYIRSVGNVGEPVISPPQ